MLLVLVDIQSHMLPTVILVILVILQNKLLLGLNVLAVSGDVLLVLLVMAVMIIVLRLVYHSFII